MEIESDEIELTDLELSRILDHMEVGYTDPKIWLRISLENILHHDGILHDEEYLKICFEKWCTKVKRKKSILDKLNILEIDKISFLTALEKRLLEFLQQTTDEYVCRVCLIKNYEILQNLYEICPETNITFAQKIIECSNIEEPQKNDGLPENICQSCLKLLKIAYEFKSLCEKSDENLRTIKTHLKQNNSEEVVVVEQEEYVEYIIETRIPEGEEAEDEDEELQEEQHLIEEIPSSTITATIKQKIPNESVEQDVVRERVVTEVVQEETEKQEHKEIHQCEICGIICCTKVSLKKHNQRHSIQRPHHCTICKKDFKTKISLKIHMRSHTGERPYVCESCGKAFKTWSAVSNHRAIHSELKLFKCSFCDYRASTKANLQIHNRTHTRVQPYSCGKCSMKFSTASNRQKHIRNVHDKLKSHKCENCERSFFSRESLRKHMVTHTGLKPYKCLECPMTYGWYNGLKKHMKGQHSGIKMPTEKYFLDLMEN